MRVLLGILGGLVAGGIGGAVMATYLWPPKYTITFVDPTGTDPVNAVFDPRTSQLIDPATGVNLDLLPWPCRVGNRC